MMLVSFEREIELLKTISHPNIVSYFDSSSDGTHLNIFLECESFSGEFIRTFVKLVPADVPGGSVAALLRNYGAFEETLVSNFIRQVLQGVAYLHERDIIHRDIKGANILGKFF